MVGVLLTLLLFAQPTAAELAEARSLFAEGRDAYERGDFETAAKRFERSYVLSRAPGLLFNWAQALRLKGDCAGALEKYRSFLAEAAGSPNRKDALEYQRSMERCVQDRAAAPSTPEPAATDVAPTPASDALVAEDAGGLEKPMARVAPPGLIVSTIVTGVLAASSFGLAVGFQASSRARAAALMQFYDAPTAWNAGLASVERAGRSEAAASLGFFVGAAVATLATCVMGLVMAVTEW